MSERTQPAPPSLASALAAALHALRSEMFALQGELGLQAVNQSRVAQRLRCLTTLVDDLDWRRRLARGEVAARPELCQIGALLDALAVEIEAAWPESVIVIGNAAELPEAWVDPVRLREALRLAALDLLRRTCADPPTLKLAATAQAGSLMLTLSAKLRLSGADAAALFWPLEQLPRRLARCGPGLFVARALARRLGGELQLRRYANGTCVLALTVPPASREETRCPMC
jgi:hypothetical protein